jgi:hypothetical protein
MFGGTLHLFKSPTVPGDPAQGVLADSFDEAATSRR